MYIVAQNCSAPSWDSAANIMLSVASARCEARRRRPRCTSQSCVVLSQSCIYATVYSTVLTSAFSPNASGAVGTERYLCPPRYSQILLCLLATAAPLFELLFALGVRSSFPAQIWQASWRTKELNLFAKRALDRSNSRLELAP